MILSVELGHNIVKTILWCKDNDDLCKIIAENSYKFYRPNCQLVYISPCSNFFLNYWVFDEFLHRVMGCYGLHFIP
jgi:hypothetical protein